MLLAFVPSGPSWTLEPELALALFVAPVLLDAAFDTSLRDLRNNWLPVSTLVLVAVGVTTAAVAVVAHWLRPDMPWAVAIALGAIVAPPDAAAATAILRQVNLPYRIQKILEGESLLNDASALLIYRVAVGLVAAEHMKVQRVRAVDCAGAVRKPHRRLPVRAGLGADHAPHHRGAERHHHAIRRHLHGVDRRRAYRAVRHPHHRRLCDHDRAHRARAHAGAAAGGLLCGVGNRRVRAQRAGVHPDRHAAQPDLVRAR